MRNTTKLKALLLKYSVTFNMSDDEVFAMMITDKQNNKAQLFEGESYSIVVAKAYSYMLKDLKGNINR